MSPGDVLFRRIATFLLTDAKIHNFLQTTKFLT